MNAGIQARSIIVGNADSLSIGFGCIDNGFLEGKNPQMHIFRYFDGKSHKYLTVMEQHGLSHKILKDCELANKKKVYNHSVGCLKNFKLF